MITRSLFKPAWWLKNPHLQTMATSLFSRGRQPKVRHEKFELPDGDFLDLAWADQGLSTDSPLVIILHGLGGNMHSSYVTGQMVAYQQRGWRTLVMHFRGANGQSNRYLRAYHSGDTADLDYVLRVLAAREPQSCKWVVGFSLGGNVLLKWLGEQGPQTLIAAAVAVSVPFQLNIAADRLNQGFSRLYQRYLLQRLKRIFLRKIARHPHETLAQALISTQCFWTFDDQITAPMYGFSNVHDYYRESSSKQYLKNIATPTLIIHAIDDPFMLPTVIPQAEDLSASVTLELSDHGGHVGFVAGYMPGRPKFWLDERIPAFFTTGT